ncbi:SET domain-containing protein [Mycena sanguinolenta]|uniref:SET domain-containing protein n=1 Tax=Mycena sanguinolenta TaxID=230812 RepID=A0A8H7D4Q5_9AGAR|nr:SET domain-containing protein [Mycena sanguinolenta]
MASTPTMNLPRVAIVDVPGKGKGVVAQEHIQRGTLIVSEKPRIMLPCSNKLDGLKFLSSLSRDDLAFLLSFPCGQGENAIFGRLKHFTPCVADGEVVGWGLCSTVCRVNHTCYSPMGGPNSAYFWNDSTGKEELRAIKEIREGHEVEVSYMENAVNYEDPPAKLRRDYGFDCSCKGCARSTAERATSQERIMTYNNFVRDLPNRFGPGNPLLILKDIEKHIIIICEEGYTGEIGSRAHDAFQLCAYYGDAASARQWETICRDSHALYHGKEWEGFTKAERLAAKPQDFRAWRQLGSRKLKGPNKQVLEYFYPKVETAVPAAPNETPNPSVVSTPATEQDTSTGQQRETGAQKLSRGQKKNARAKAKKAAAKAKDSVPQTDAITE